jgi:hypothetical protein
MTGQVVAALAGPAADRGAILRAHAALAVVKDATMAALALPAPAPADGPPGPAEGTLDPADRAEILATALRTLDDSQR